MVGCQCWDEDKQINLHTCIDVCVCEYVYVFVSIYVCTYITYIHNPKYGTKYFEIFYFEREFWRSRVEPVK